MTSIKKTLLSASIATAVAFASLAHAGDDDGADAKGAGGSTAGVVANATDKDKGANIKVTKDSSGALNVELVDPNTLQVLAPLMAQDRLNEPTVNTQLNKTQGVGNAFFAEMSSLAFMASNASSKALDTKGIAELVKLMAGIKAFEKAIVDIAAEKDPTVKAEIQKAFQKAGLSDLVNRVNRLENLHGFLGWANYEVQLDSNTGFLTTIVGQTEVDGKLVGGQSIDCTTEGYMTKTPIDENYIVCVDANAGTVNNGSDQLRDAYFGYFLNGDTSATLLRWPFQFTDVRYFLDTFNISAGNPKTEVYFKGLMYGGEHMNPKVYSTGSTQTTSPVVKASGPKLLGTSSAVQVPLQVRVVNSKNDPVNTQEVDE